MGIYHKNNCPICNHKLTKTYKYKLKTYSCTNKCYSYEKLQEGKTHHSTTIYIFDEHFNTKHHNRETKKTEDLKINKIVHAKIKYWKENERYIMKFLSN